MLGQPPYRAVLARGVAALENDEHPLAAGDQFALELDQFDLQFVKRTPVMFVVFGYVFLLRHDDCLSS